MAHGVDTITTKMLLLDKIPVMPLLFEGNYSYAIALYSIFTLK